MTTVPTDYQIINNREGQPQYVVIPYAEYLNLAHINLKDGVPAKVVDLIFDKNYSPLRAWREYLKLTQAAVAQKLGISQSAYS